MIMDMTDFLTLDAVLVRKTILCLAVSLSLLVNLDIKHQAAIVVLIFIYVRQEMIGVTEIAAYKVKL